MVAYRSKADRALSNVSELVPVGFQGGWMRSS